MSAFELENAITSKDFLNQNKVSLENVHQLFIPNTYYLYWTISPEDLLVTLLRHYNKFWNKERKEKAKKLKLSPLEITTLASIIQKETSKIDEMPLVSGLYLNRLKSGWLLQADPTLIYAINLKKEKKLKINRLFYKDLHFLSKYNTYLHKGLPPSPISLVEIPALEAALNPKNHNYYYMVSSTEKKGYHEFSTTLKRHEEKRAKYLKKINKN